jgi:hypothetical protein
MADKKKWNDPAQNDEKSIYQDDDGLYHFKIIPERELPKDLPPAKSQRSTGRNCPKCAGQLTAFEYIKEKDIMWLRCSNCLTKYYENDLDPQNLNPLDVADELTLPYDNPLFREISAERILYYMNRVDRAKQKEDQG